MINYSDHPQSLTERRARKEEDASKWTPRDALIYALRRMDEGKLDPDALIIMVREIDKDGTYFYGWTVASPDTNTTVGLIARVEHLFHRGLDC